MKKFKGKEIVSQIFESTQSFGPKDRIVGIRIKKIRLLFEDEETGAETKSGPKIDVELVCGKRSIILYPAEVRALSAMIQDALPSLGTVEDEMQRGLGKARPKKDKKITQPVLKPVDIYTPKPLRKGGEKYRGKFKR